MTKYENFKDKQDWLKARTKYITSTEVAALFGCERSGEYGKSYFELWHNKKDKTFEIDEGGNDARKGLYFEPAIAKWFSDIHGLGIEEFNEFAYDDDTRQGSSFDYEINYGLVDGVDLSGALMEIKTAKYSIYKEKWLNDMPPAYIEFQVQMQMKMCGADKAVIVLFVDGDFSPRHWIIKACPDTHKAIDIKCAEFWKSVDEGIEPEPDFDKDSDFVIGLNQDAEGVEEASEELVLLLEGYKAAKAREKAVASELKKAKARIFAATKAEVLMWDDCKATLKTNKNGTRVLNIK